MRALRLLARWFGLPIVLVGAWWLLTRDGANFYVPQPGQILDSFVHVWLGELLVSDVVPSLLRLAAALVISIVVGIGLGAVIGASRRVRWLVEPLLEFMRAIPATILIPVLLLVIGINDATKITVIVLGCVWPILLNTIAGVRAIDEVLSDTGHVYRIEGRARLMYLTLPGASPQIMTGIRQSLSVGLILMVVSEMFASTAGIGFAIIDFQNRIAIPDMWGGILLLGIIGVALSALFQTVQRRILAWYIGLKEASHDG